ncbi:MAG: hypothetical protein FWC80_01855 [Firmicutes bacterium]|nr:hypothetical protein [Bacillota bacterium]
MMVEHGRDCVDIADNDIKKIESALLKKAQGYTTEETVEEYSGDQSLIKRKITEKYVPADLSAIKLVLEASNAGKGELEELSDEEIMKLRGKYLRELGKMVVSD